MTAELDDRIFVGVSNSRQKKFEAVHCSEAEFLCMLKLYFSAETEREKVVF